MNTTKLNIVEFLPFIIIMLLGIPVEFFIAFLASWLSGEDIIFGGIINPFYFVLFMIAGNALFYIFLSVATLPFAYFNKENIKKKLFLLTLIIFASGFLVLSLVLFPSLYLFFSKLF